MVGRVCWSTDRALRPEGVEVMHPLEVLACRVVEQEPDADLLLEIIGLK